MSKLWGKDWGPGYQYFKCHQCERRWKEKARDCTRLSNSICKNCHEVVQPYDYEFHFEWGKNFPF